MDETPNNPDTPNNVVPIEDGQSQEGVSTYIPSSDAMPDNPYDHGDDQGLIPKGSIGIPTPIAPPQPEQPAEQPRQHPSAG